MTFTTLRRAEAYGLGIRTDRGILDVAAAEKDFAAGAPTTITAVFKGIGDWEKLHVLVDRAKARSSGERYFIPEEKAAFGPCVTDPEKIVCIGLNYRRHAAETGQPVPKQPILFNKYNSALNCCGGTVVVSREKATQFDYETELVIVMGRRARNVSEADFSSPSFPSRGNLHIRAILYRRCILLRKLPPSHDQNVNLDCLAKTPALLLDQSPAEQC